MDGFIIELAGCYYEEYQQSGLMLLVGRYPIAGDTRNIAVFNGLAKGSCTFEHFFKAPDFVLANRGLIESIVVALFMISVAKVVQNRFVCRLDLVAFWYYESEQRRAKKQESLFILALLLQHLSNNNIYHLLQ